MNPDKSNPIVFYALLVIVIGCALLLMLFLYPFIADRFFYKPTSITIFDAAQKGSVKDIEYYIKRGATVNEKDSVGTPLIFWAATWNTDADVMKYLIDNGADVNAKYQDGISTPLSKAVVFNSNVEIHQMLIENGADVNVKSDQGRTPLHDVFIWDKFDFDVMKLMIEKGADVNAKNDDGETPFFTALRKRKDDSDAIKYLIDHGADVNAKNQFGDTPLYFTAYSVRNAEVLKHLIENGADVNARSDDGRTPLDSAKTDEMKAILRAAGGKTGEELSGVIP